MEPTSVKHLGVKLLEPTSVEDLRIAMTERFARCLLGELERGARMAHYRAPRKVVGVDLVVNYSLEDLSKQVEYALNAATARHHQKKLQASYKVTLCIVNSTLRFAAHVRPGV